MRQTYQLTLSAAPEGSAASAFRTTDPGAGDDLAKQGKLAFDYGMFWFKGQHIGSGQAPVKKYNRQLRDLIAAGKAEPSFIVSHELPLDRAPEAYEHFDKRDDGWTKVVLHPATGGGGCLKWLER